MSAEPLGLTLLSGSGLCLAAVIESVAGTRGTTRIGALGSTVSGVRDESLAALLSAYDAQLRAHVHDRLPDSIHVERDGPLLRTVGGMVEYRDFDDLDGDEIDELIVA
jgi:hypothetical protein